MRADTRRRMLIVTYWVQDETPVRVEANLPLISMGEGIIKVGGKVSTFSFFREARRGRVFLWCAYRSSERRSVYMQ